MGGQNVFQPISLRNIIEKFAASGWDLFSIPAHAWLKGESNKDTLIASIKQADREGGSCGCELDLLYKRAFVLLSK